MQHIYETIYHQSQIKCHNFGLTKVKIVTDKSIQTIILYNLVKLNSIGQGKVEVSEPHVYNRLYIFFFFKVQKLWKNKSLKFIKK